MYTYGMVLRDEGEDRPMFGVVIDRSTHPPLITCGLVEPDMLSVVQHNGGVIAELRDTQTALVDIGDGNVVRRQVQLVSEGGTLVLECAPAPEAPSPEPDEYRGAWALPW